MDGQPSFEKRFLDSLPTGVAIHVEGRLVYANPALCRMTGARAPDEWLGRPVLDFVHPDFHAATLARMGALYRRERAADWTEVEFLRRDGSTFPAEVTAAMVDWEGRPAAQTVVIDVSRRKAAEAALRESEERYRRLIEELPVGVVLHVDGKVVYANREAARAIGSDDPAAHIGEDVLAHVHPDDRERARERLLSLYGPADRVPFASSRLLRRDGTVVEVDMCGVASEWHGQPAGQVLFVDVTERRELERRVQQAQKNESMEVLAGGVAHDFNNLLVGILGSAELALQELAPDTAARPLVERIGESARLAANLARQMLAYAGRARVVLERVDLGALLREMSGILAAAVPHKVRLRWALTPQPTPIEGDPTRLRQVVMNLVTNAGEAIGAGEGVVTLTTRRVEADAAALRSPYVPEALPPGTYVALEVADDGSGMDEEVLRRLFDPFFSTRFTGRGLGLAAVLGIVRAHHGTVRVESRPGAGSRVQVLLPVASEAAEPGAAGAGSGAAAAAGSARPVHDAARASGGTVLVVDDDDSVREVATRMLRRAGFRILTAEDGEQGMALFRQRADATGADRIACVLLDLAMPRMDGHETLAALRALRPDVPVVVFSGFAEREAGGPAAGGARVVFLSKPFVSDELLAAIDRARR